MRKVLTLLRSPSLWQNFLQEYFSEVEIHRLPEKDPMPQNAEIIFLEADCCQPALVQKIRVAKSLNPLLRVFGLGKVPPETAGLFDSIFAETGDLLDFTKRISEKLPLKPSVDLLVADDDPDILSMVCDYFSGRNAPSFEVFRAGNGNEALEIIKKKKPDAMILDIKMPIMSGSELYYKLQRQGQKIPTIIFFDAISAGDLDMIKKAGRPVIIEKGYRESSLAYLMATIKKLVYFAA